MSSNFVKNRIQAAVDLNDLLPILKHLSLDAVKEFASQQIENESEDTLRTIHYRESSINAVFPSDVMQHILSFDGLYHPRAVNQEWQSLSENNANVQMRQLYAATVVHSSAVSGANDVDGSGAGVGGADSSASHVGDVDSPMTTWIVHPKRRYLHTVEQELGYQAPMSMHAVFANNSLKNGDRVLIHDGVYEHLTSNSLMHSIEIIGLGNKIIIKEPKEVLFITREDGIKVDLKNLSLFVESSNQNRFGFLLIMRLNDKFSMSHCTFQGFTFVINSCPWAGISGRCFKISDCVFIAPGNRVAVWLQSNSRASICNSLFKNCANAIQIGRDRADVECVGNTFEDCRMPPIEILGNANCVLRDNVIIGNNQYGGVRYDANVVYDVRDF